MEYEGQNQFENDLNSYVNYLENWMPFLCPREVVGRLSAIRCSIDDSDPLRMVLDELVRIIIVNWRNETLSCTMLCYLRQR